MATKTHATAREKRVTLKDLATHLGLSISTISRALKGAPDIGRETIALVKKAAEEYGYTPDLSGVKLRTGQTFTLYYLKTIQPQQDVPDGAVMAEIAAITSYLQNTRYQLQIVPWNPEQDDAMQALKRIISARLADGVMLDMTQPQDARVRYLLENQVPFITLGRTELFTEHPYVDANNEKAAYDATRYLLGLGHRRIALMSAKMDYTFSLQRRRGYLRALDEAGLTADSILMREDGLSAKSARDVTNALLNRSDPPTGFICVNESTALGVMTGIRDCGKQVGIDCDIVSRASTSISDYLNPPLPTCYLDIKPIAKVFCEFLLRSIAGEPATALQQVFDCAFIAPPSTKRGNIT